MNTSVLNGNFEEQELRMLRHLYFATEKSCL
jgi:hypothetical protein